MGGMKRFSLARLLFAVFMCCVALTYMRAEIELVRSSGKPGLAAGHALGASFAPIGFSVAAGLVFRSDSIGTVMFFVLAPMVFLFALFGR